MFGVLTIASVILNESGAHLEYEVHGAEAGRPEWS
jgi:hypothetical protein